MATQVLTNTRIWVAQYDFSGDLANVDLGVEYDELEDTTFGSQNHRSRVAGLPTADLDFQGLVKLGSGAIEEIMFSRVTSPTAGPASVVPAPSGGATVAEPSAEGDIAWMLRGASYKYVPGAEVGAVFRFSGNIRADEEPVRGRVLVPRPSAARSSSGTSSSQQLGAVASGERLFAALHVFDGSGGNLDVDVRSDDNSGMTTPTTRISFTTATGATSEWATPVDGAIADDYFDVDYTISAGTFDFAVTVGIA